MISLIHKFTDFRIQQGIERYKTGESLRAITKSLKIDEEILKYYLLQENIFRTHNESVRNGKSKAKVKDDVLDILTPEALYWIGFIYADGHLAKDRPRIVLGLSEIDKIHVEKFANFFGTDIITFKSEGQTLKQNGYISNPAWRAQFSSQKIYNKLKELGINPGKTWDICPHVLLRYSRDFWRGVFDGDGSVYNTKVQGAFLCGHKNTIEHFLIFINESGVDTQTKPQQSKKSEHLWSCDLHSHKAKATLNLLYKEATIYLDRKYEKYLEILG